MMLRPVSSRDPQLWSLLTQKAEAANCRMYPMAMTSSSSYHIHSFIPLPCAECDDSLPFSGASSIPFCYILFPSTLLHQLFILPSVSCLPLGLVDSKFIYNTLLGIRFSPILCTCPNQCNLCSLIVFVMVGFLTIA
jgi:hypothetical protein